MDIPVTFTYKGKEHVGFLSNVAGGGANTLFHLYVPYNGGNYYWGQLFLAANGEWRFHNQANDMLYLSDYFASVVINFYQ